MTVWTDTYIIIGCRVPLDWGSLPGDDEYDDWHERNKDLVIYRPKKGDLVCFEDMDGSRYRFIGKIIDVHNERDIHYSSFFETFTVERLTKEIEETTPILRARGVKEEVALHIISNAT